MNIKHPVLAEPFLMSECATTPSEILTTETHHNQSMIVGFLGHDPAYNMSLSMKNQTSRRVLAVMLTAVFIVAGAPASADSNNVDRDALIAEVKNGGVTHDYPGSIDAARKLLAADKTYFPHKLAESALLMVQIGNEANRPDVEAEANEILVEIKCQQSERLPLSAQARALACVPSMLRTGQLYEIAGDHDKARASFERILVTYSPDSPMEPVTWARWALAALDIDSGHLEKADRALEAGLQQQLTWVRQALSKPETRGYLTTLLATRALKNQSAELAAYGREVSRMFSAPAIGKSEAPIEDERLSGLSPMAQPYVLRGITLMRLKRGTELRKLWQEDVAAYTNLIDALNPEKTAATSRNVLSGSIDHELLAIRFAEIFRAAGDAEFAREAYIQALAQQAVRIEKLSHQSEPTMQFGIAMTRHRYASGMLALSIAGRLDAQVGLSEALAAKGLGDGWMDQWRAENPKLAQKITRLSLQYLTLPKLARKNFVSTVVSLRNEEIETYRKGKAVPIRPADLALSLDALRDRLGDATLVGAIRYRPVAGVERTPSPARYAVYRIDATGIALADAGEADALEAKVTLLRTQINAGALGTNSDVALRKTATTLYQALLAPVLPKSGLPQRLVIDPDANLWLLPYEVLVTQSGQYVGATTRIHYINSPRSLLGTNGARERTGPALVMGDPDFGTPSDNASLATATRGTIIGPLPGTRAEAQAVDQALKARGIDVDLLLGKDVTADALRDVKSPVVLHVASHGFVLGGLASTTPADTNEAARWQALFQSAGTNAALAMSGANTRGDESFIFSAEVETLRLRGTELVTLSACDTGSGQWFDAQGFASLRRSFERAGARAVIASAWRAPDAATADFMRVFYANWSPGKNPDEAMLLARQAQMQRTPHPFYWGGFTVSRNR